MGKNSAFVAPRPWSITIGCPWPAVIVETLPRRVSIVAKRSRPGLGSPLDDARKPTPRWRLRWIASRPVRNAAIALGRSAATRSHVASSAISSASGSRSEDARTRSRPRCASRSQLAPPATVSRMRARPAGLSKSSLSKRSRRTLRLSGMEAVIGSYKGAPDALGHARGLLISLDLDRETCNHLMPAAAHVVDRHDLGAGADPRSRRHGRREADLVPAVVDAELEARRLDQAAPQAVDRRQREVAVGDGRPEGALGLGALDVDVDPLVVTREPREQVDVLLGDLAPVGGPDLLADEAPELLDPVGGDERHGNHPTSRGSGSPPNTPHPRPVHSLHFLTQPN